MFDEELEQAVNGIVESHFEYHCLDGDVFEWAETGSLITHASEMVTNYGVDVEQRFERIARKKLKDALAAAEASLAYQTHVVRELRQLCNSQSLQEAGGCVAMVSKNARRYFDGDEIE